MNCKFTLLFLLPILLERTPETSCQKDPDSHCERPCKNATSIEIEKEDCTCYKSNYCPSKLWDSSDGNVIVDDFPLQISIVPFARDLQAAKRTSFNFTFVVKEKSVIGFAFRFMNNCWDDRNKIICRYFDWSTSNKSFVDAVIFNDDVYFDYNRHEKRGSFCNLEISALSSTNRRWKPLNYTFAIPSIDEIDERDVCKWKSLILIDLDSFDQSEQSINAVFNAAPSNFSVSLYKIELLMKEFQKVLWSTTVNTTQQTNVVKVLNVIAHNELQISVQLIDRKCSNRSNCCSPSTSTYFRLVNYNTFEIATEHFKVLSVCIIILVVLCVAVLIVALTHHNVNKYFKNRYPAKVVKIFLVYSFDVPEHLKVVECFADYLQRHCHCEVLLDNWHIQNKNPHKWINECLSVADYVVIVWSRGAHLKVRNSQLVYKSEQGFLGKDLFGNCIAKIEKQIEEEMSRSDRFLNLCLPYTPKDKFPAPMSYLHHFQLPDHLNAFLCRIHDVLPRGYSTLLHRLFYPSLPFSDLSKCPGAEQLLASIKTMQELETEGQWYKQLCPSLNKRPTLESSTELLMTDEEESSETKEDEGEDEGEVLPVPSFPPNVEELPIFGDTQLRNECRTKEEENEDLPDSIFGP